MAYIAHITYINGIRLEQTVREHLLNTAMYAGLALSGVGLHKTGYLTGLLHDMGKYTDEFQFYLKSSCDPNGKEMRRGSVIHTFQAVIYILEKYKFCSCDHDGIQELTCEIIAYAAGAHHGLFDCVDIENKNGFCHRLAKDRDDIGYSEAKERFFAEISEETIDKLFFEAVAEIRNLIDKVRKITNINYEHDKKNTNLSQNDVVKNQRNRSDFIFGLISRLVLSAVVNGDRKDTALFMSGNNEEKMSETDERNYRAEGVCYGSESVNHKVESEDKNIEMKSLWERQCAYCEEKVRTLKGDSPVNIARKQMSDMCYRRGSKMSGILKLNLPTGAGKTIASLRFALNGARTFGKKRIIFIIPLLSILEQNSKVIREYVEDNSLILEHHSNVINEKFINCKENDKANGKENCEEVLSDYELIMQTWDSPIIISTMVQFLNILFSGNMSSVRRMQALSDSIIVIDEIQSLPKKTIHMFNTAVNFLAYCCNATIVLSSATQPCFDKTDEMLIFKESTDEGNPYNGSTEIVPYRKDIWDIFKRTEIINKIESHGITIEQLADFALELIKIENSVLVICNTKKTAANCYKLLSEKSAQTVDSMNNALVLHHLSNAMCPAHRRNELDEIDKELQFIRGNPGNRKMICVATQLVEAGVDFSFDSVIRVEAGLDNIAQAAGRCNRHGEGDVKNVYVVRLRDEEINMLTDIVLSQQAFESFYNKFEAQSDRFGNDMLSEQSVEFYYEILFNMNEVRKQMSYPVNLAQNHDIGVSFRYSDGAYGSKADVDATLYDLLSQNERCKGNDYNRKMKKCEFLSAGKKTAGFYLSQAFRLAGKKFKVFDDNTLDLIVPYDSTAVNIINELQKCKAAFNFEEMRKLIKKVGDYTVQIFEWQIDKLKENGMIIEEGEAVPFTILSDKGYDKHLGVIVEENVENSIV